MKHLPLWVGQLAESVDRHETGRYNEALADIITTPGAMTKLKELRKLHPRSEKAINIVGTVLAGLGLQGTEDFLAPPAYAGSAGAGSNP